MGKRYIAVNKCTGHVLSSPTNLRDPDTNQLACAIWTWVPDPNGNKAHHFSSRSEAKRIVRLVSPHLDKVSFFPVI